VDCREINDSASVSHKTPSTLAPDKVPPDREHHLMYADVVQTIHSFLPKPYDHWLTERLAFLREEDLRTYVHPDYFGDITDSIPIFGQQIAFVILARRPTRDFWTVLVPFKDELTNIEGPSLAVSACEGWDDVPDAISTVNILRAIAREQYRADAEGLGVHYVPMGQPRIFPDLAVRQPYNAIPTLAELGELAGIRNKTAPNAMRSKKLL